MAVETNDATRQLGINPSDMVNSSGMIQTRADYDYTSVDAEILAKATQIRYTLELFQKNDLGTYDESNPLAIRDYLQEISKDNKRGIRRGRILNGRRQISLAQKTKAINLRGFSLPRLPVPPLKRKDIRTPTIRCA